MKNGRVVIVGAGVAGLACALACARAGAQVQVLEARAAATQVPAHVDVVPNLLRDLAQLGVAEACVRRGFAYSGLAVVDEHGAEAFSLPTHALAGPRLPPAAGIALDDLLDVLATAAVQHGATLHRGCAARAVDAVRGCVRCDDGQAFEADLIVLATGAESSLVRAVFGANPPGALRHTWWHALLPRPLGLDRTTWMAGSLARRLLLVPLDMARAGVAVVGPVPTGEAADARALMRMLQAWGALPRRIAEAIRPAQPVALRDISSALRDAPWHRGAVLCVGAAAHAVAPAFGQASALALEDAVVLGELLGAGLDRATMLERFSERRVPRAQQLHALTERASRWMTHPEPATDLMQLAGDVAALVAQPA
jgi:2-polyprenyl-6-methoxyphenol hydroxylase-like FAD-dependent oxidoreductase